MEVWEAALWGIAGGLCVEALELLTHIQGNARKWSWRRPIPQGLSAFIASTLIRVGVGAILAAANSSEITGALPALGLGVGAPLVIEKLARAAQLSFVEGPAAEPGAAPATISTELEASGGT